MRPPLIVLLCATTLANAFSIGALPSLLPEIAAGTGMPDWQLGIFAGTFGFARMVADLPAGLFIARRLRAALIAGPVALALGSLLIVLTDGIGLLFAGRALMGVGHALGMLAGLTAVLQTHAARRLSMALNAFEFSAMIALLGGAGLVAVLPRTLDWKTVLLLACAPQLLAFALLPWVLTQVPRRFEHPAATPVAGSAKDPHGGALVLLAFAAGATVAIAYASVEQFAIPVRGSREFGLDRAGIARIFMVMQACDILALLPLGALADRTGSVRVLGGVTLALAAGSVLIAFAPLPGMVAGTVVFGVGMAGWMIPLSVLRRHTPPGRVAWRTALYRVGVDGGIFIGPFLGGLFAGRHLAVVAVVLAIIGIGLLRASAHEQPAFEPVQYPP